MITGGKTRGVMPVATASFALLGPVAAYVGDHQIAIGGPRAQAVIAALLLEANRVVPLDRVIAAAWGDDAPETARFQAQNRTSALRRALREAGADNVIETFGAGYLIRVDEGALDADIFQRHLQLAQQHVADGELTHAARALAAGLALWRGPALYGLQTPRLLAAGHRLDEARLAARELLVEVELGLGRHHEVVGDLVELIEAHPGRERPVAQLMIALYRAGRRPDALDLYQRTRDRLGRDLGVDPGPDLSRIRDRILRDDPDLLVRVGEVGTGAGGGDPRPRLPACTSMLPRGVPDFVGRAAIIDDLDTVARDRSTGAVCAITGPPGVGKTALAVHWAHRRADLFPDGRLFVDLRGYGPGPPVRPGEALTSLLLGLGMAPDQIPGEEDRAVGRYRALLSGKRAVVVLDNASAADQVRPLLPPTPGAMVLVTSRNRLTGLTALDGARLVSLGTLDAHEAVELLRRLLGAGRAAREPAAVAELAIACGRLPLALRISAAHLGEQADRSLAEYVDDLRGAGRLGALQVAGDELAALGPAFDRSYARLGRPAARLFRLVALAPGPEISTGSAAALAGERVEVAAQLLDTLHAAHLVERREPDRYSLHDLLREYAAQRVAEEDSPAERTEATRRLYQHYVCRADAANRLLFPSALRLPEQPSWFDFADRDEALLWLDAERLSLITAAVQASAIGQSGVAWRLADALRGYFWLRHASHDGRVVAEAGLAAAAREGNVMGQAAAEFSLGMSELNTNRYEAAITHLRAAIALSRSARWAPAEAAALGNLGIAYTELGQTSLAVSSYRRALAVNEELGRSAGRANNLGNLGLLQVRTGQFRSAVRHLTEATALHQELGSRHHYAVFLHGLGQAHRHLGHLQDARASLTGALDVCRELEDADLEALILADLAGLFLDLGQIDAASGHADAAVRLALAVTDPDVKVLALVARAAARAGAHCVAAAAEDGDAAVQLGTSGASGYVMALAEACLAAIRLSQNQPELARQSAAEARQRCAASGFRDLEGRALALLAEAGFGLGEPETAREYALRAVAIHRETGNRQAETRALELVRAGASGSADRTNRWRVAVTARKPRT